LIALGAAIDDIDKKGFTSLHTACLAGHVAVVMYLLDKGANVNAKSIQGQVNTVNHSLELFELILIREGFTPLVVACREGFVDCVAWLLNHGAQLESRDASGITPLLHACSFSRNNVVEFLISRGVSRLRTRNAVRIIATHRITPICLGEHSYKK
jgi:ankyrin repeat protein